MSTQKGQATSLQETTDHFKRIPWCADILGAPAVVSFMPTCRPDEAGSVSQDGLFQISLNTSDTVPCMVGFYLDPEAAAAAATAVGKEQLQILETVTGGLAKNGGRPNEPAEKQVGGTATAPAQTLLIRCASLLCDLRTGVNGFNGTAQGGFLAAVIDEAMGNLLFNNYLYQGQLEQRGDGGGGIWKAPPNVLSLDENSRLFTASMALRFLKPLVTPCVVVATAALRRIDGRKVFFDVTVRDQHGTEYVSCEGMWMALRGRGGPKI